MTSASGHTLIHHGGAIAGQRAFLIGDLDAHVGVYYVTNSDYLPDAETRTRFFQRGSNIVLTFEGDSGSIDRLVVEAGRQRLTATRRK